MQPGNNIAMNFFSQNTPIEKNIQASLRTPHRIHGYSRSYVMSLIVALVLLNSCSSGDNKESEKTVTTGISVLPDFIITDNKGKAVNLKDFRGKMVFLNLWASWCTPCRAEMPYIQQLFEQTRGSNVQFVLLALDKDFDKSLAYFHESKFTLPVFHPSGPLPDLLNVAGIPATFIFNENGEVVRNIQGSHNYNTEEFRQLLSQ